MSHPRGGNSAPPILASAGSEEPQLALPVLIRTQSIARHGMSPLGGLNWGRGMALLQTLDPGRFGLVPLQHTLRGHAGGQVNVVHLGFLACMIYYRRMIMNLARNCGLSK